MTARRQTRIGLALALAIMVIWAGLVVAGVGYWRWTGWGILFAPEMIAAISCAYVGLFIVAHDAMHGTLAPGRPAVNLWVGRVCLALYVGFGFDRMVGPHHQHHAAPGTAADPDFDAAHPRAFWAWYLTFLRRYVRWMQPAVGCVVLLVWVAFGGDPVRLMLFWAVPAWLSSLQLFFFGTWLPHRVGEPFADAHRARGADWPFWASLLSCFHFGVCHHRHHLSPQLPWWRLWGHRAVR